MLPTMQRVVVKAWQVALVAEVVQLYRLKQRRAHSDNFFSDGKSLLLTGRWKYLAQLKFLISKCGPT